MRYAYKELVPADVAMLKALLFSGTVARRGRLARVTRAA
jgi:hypothetical protein